MFTENGLIVGEERDTEKKTVAFFCLRSSDGTVLWKGKNFAEQWWIGMTGTAGNRLFLHGFRKPDMPEQKSIITVDLATGTELWRNTEVTFWGNHPSGIIGYKDLFERRLYYVIDPESGTIVDERSDVPEDFDPHRQYEKTDFLFPAPLSDEEQRISQPAEPDRFTAGASIATTDYLVVNRYSERPVKEEGLKNTLSIIDRRTKKKVYSDVLNEQTPYPVPDSFFLDGSMLYYIKERKTFVALQLPSRP